MTSQYMVLPKQRVSSNVLLAVGQPQYNQLYVVQSADGARMTARFKLSWTERWRLFWQGDLWLEQLTFGKAFRPIKLGVEEPQA